MIRKFIAAFVIIFFAATTTAFAAEETKSGEVVHCVTGDGQAPSNWDQRDSFAKTFARQAARMDALRQLAEYIGVSYIQSKLNVDPDGNVTKNYVKSELIHDSKVFKLLEKNARQVGDAKFSFGDDGSSYCEVTMELVVPAGWKN